MTKEDKKKAVLTGIVSGITTAITLLVLTWTYIEVMDWYRDYREKQAIKCGATSHCERPGVNEFANMVAPQDTSEQESDNKIDNEDLGTTKRK